MSPESKAGAATPQSLYRLYRNAGAVAANPCTLRREFGAGQQHQFNLFSTTPSIGLSSSSDMRIAIDRTAEVAVSRLSAGVTRTRSSSPPRMAFKQIASGRSVVRPGVSTANLSLSLASLSMNGQRGGNK